MPISPTWEETTESPTWESTDKVPTWEDTSEPASISARPAFGPPGSNSEGVVRSGPSNLLEMEVASQRQMATASTPKDPGYTPEQRRRLDTGSIAENLTTAPPGLEAPMVTPEEIEKRFSPNISTGTSKALAGLLQTAAGFWNFAASPIGAAGLVTGAGAGLPGVAGAIGKATIATFALDALKAMPDAVNQYNEAINSGDPESIARTGSQLVLNLGVALGASKGLKESIKGSAVVESSALDQVSKKIETEAIAKAEVPAPATAEALRQTSEFNPPKVSEPSPKIEETVPVSEEVGPGMVGMGAADRAELKTYSEDTGIKDASITDQRELRGLDALERGEVQKWDAARQEAQSKIEKDSTWLDTLENDLISKPRPMDTVETAGMLTKLTKLRQEYDVVSEQLSKAFDAGEPTDALNLRAQELSDRISRTEGAVSIGGAASESGRSLNALKMMMAKDFTLAAMESRRRADKGGAPLDYNERIELIKAHKDIQEKLKASEAAEAEARSKASDAEARAVLAEQQAKISKDPEFHPSILQHAERFVSRMEETSKKYAKEIFGQFNSPTPDVLAKAAFIGATKLARIGLDVTKWTAEMVKELGPGFSKFAEQVLEMSKKVLDDEISAAEKVPKAPRISKAVKRAMTSEEQKADITAKIDVKIKSGEGSEITNLVQQLARQFVEGGIKELDPLLDALHHTLKQVDPNIERRTVQDALTGYGKFTRPKEDAVSKTLAELKGQGLETGKLLDLESGKPLKATGFLRGKMSDVRRRLVAKVNEYKRKFGVVTTDPATQLRSALDARKRAINNQINDLAEQINSRKKFIKEKSKSPTDPELDELVKFRDELRKEFDDTFGKPEMSDEARLKIATDAAEKAEVRWNERLENARKGSFDSAKPKSKQTTSPELEAIRARTEAIREQVKELKDLDIGIQETKREAQLQSQKEALEKSISELERKIREGDIKPSGAKMSRPGDPALEELLQKRDKLNRDLAEARKKPAAQKESERIDRMVKSLEKQISKRESKLASGDLSGIGSRVNRPLQPELEVARQKLDDVNRRIEEARKLSRPKKTREEIALQSLKTRIANETAKLAEKIAKGDFSSTPKRPPIDISKDAPTMKAKAELERVKNEWLRKGVEERQNNLRGLAKASDLFLESLNLQQNLVASFDLSALRQAAFQMFNPFKAVSNLKAIGSMLSALSKSRAEFLEQQIFNRPNATNGIYSMAKLRLVRLDETKFSLQDESIRGRWAQKIPGIGASNRAFVTLLNRVRADSFDALYSSAQNKSAVATRAIGAFVNDATGYGDLGSGRLGRTADALSTVLWSPRLLASRFRLLTAASLIKGTMETRKLIAIEYGKTLLGIWSMYQLASMAGFEIEEDRRSSSYGKLRDGNVRIDPMGGLLQVTVLEKRLQSGERLTGKGKEMKALPFDTLASFLRMKFRPSISAGLDAVTFLTQDDLKNVVGDEITPTTIARDLTVPMSFRDVHDLMEDAGVAKGTLYEIFSVFGAGVQVYDEFERKR